MPTEIRWHRIALFYALTLLGSATAGLLLYVLELEKVAQVGLTSVAMFSPLMATVVCNKLDSRPLLGGLASFKLSRWILFAIGLGLGVSILTLVIGAVLPGSTWDLEMTAFFDQVRPMMPPEEFEALRTELLLLPVHPVILAFPQAIIAGVTINAVFAFGEEVGWRGWLEEELATVGFWTLNLMVGTLWGFWHAPLILAGHNYPHHPVAGVFMFVLICMGLAPWHSQLRRSSGSVWTAAIFHGTINASAGISTLVVGGSEMMVGLPGAAGLCALLVANGGLWWWRRSRAASEPNPA